MLTEKTEALVREANEMWTALKDLAETRMRAVAANAEKGLAFDAAYRTWKESATPEDLKTMRAAWVTYETAYKSTARDFDGKLARGYEDWIAKLDAATAAMQADVGLHVMNPFRT